MQDLPIMPLNGRVLVKREKNDLITDSGIYIAQTAMSEKPDTGTVVKVGYPRIDENGRELPIRIKEGQKVMFRKYAGDEIEFHGEKYLLLEEEVIIAAINNVQS